MQVDQYQSSALFFTVHIAQNRYQIQHEVLDHGKFIVKRHCLVDRSRTIGRLEPHDLGYIFRERLVDKVNILWTYIWNMFSDTKSDYQSVKSNYKLPTI